MHYQLDADRSTLVIQARSSVGEITWLTHHLRGGAQMTIEDGHLVGASADAWLEIDLENLRSGNTVYDGELLRRIDARRFPVARVELQQLHDTVHPSYRVAGPLTFHGTTNELAGELSLEVRDDDVVVVSGEQDVDIRDFDVPAPSMLMLKIYPDVRVTLAAVLVPAPSDPTEGP